jgi:hypothetical protein
MTGSRNEKKLSEYIETLRRALAPIPAAERDDIAEEIRMHVRERLTSDPRLVMDDILGRLGTAQALARQYQNSQMLTRAARSYSPFVILRAALRWAVTGMQGFLVFNIAVIGYALGIGFVLLALVKPMFPDMIGLWMGPRLFEFGFRPENVRLSPAHELLGEWFVPVTFGLGVLFTMGTSKVLRGIMSRFGRLRVRLTWRDSHPAMV